jgi:ribonuclease VapC
VPAPSLWAEERASLRSAPREGAAGLEDLRRQLPETAIVIDASRDPIASRRFDELVDVAELRVEPVTHDQARIARDAYRDFGKDSGYKAGLNFGDCFAYALAKSTGEALLFKGNDFSHTDITPALPAAAG